MIVGVSSKLFCLHFYIGQAVYGGKVVINVAYFGVPVHQETRDVCEEVSCPIAAGDFVLSHTQTLPGFTPPVSFTSPVFIFMSF